MIEIWVVVAILASGLVAGVTGFGFGLISMGVLVAFMPLQKATAIVSLVTLGVTLQNLWTTREAVVWKETLPILATALPATAVGVYLLTRLNTAILRTGLGIMVIGGCAVMMLRPTGKPLTRAFPWSYLAGALGGVWGGALGTGGPPVVLYILLRGWDKTQSKGLLCAYFTVTSVWRIVLLFSQGMMTREVLRLSALLFIPGLLASLAGIYIFKRLSTPAFRWATLLVLVGLAIKMMIP